MAINCKLIALVIVSIVMIIHFIDQVHLFTIENQPENDDASSSTPLSTSSSSSSIINQSHQSFMNNLINNISIINEKLLQLETIVNNLQEKFNQLNQSNQLNNKNNNDNHSSVEQPMNDLKAKCIVRPNRHVALLNQQNVNGEIQLKQLPSNDMPKIQMQIQLSGFKVNNCDGSDNDDDDDHEQNSCNSTLTNNHDNNKQNNNNNNNNNNTMIENEQQQQQYAFAMHVHEGSDLSYDCQSVGNHYNPLNMTHGGPNDTIRHLGDLGNIYANQHGIVHMNDLRFNNLSLNSNHSNSIVNRAIVIHNGRDDLGRNSNPASKNTGNSGIRIACCLITLINDHSLTTIDSTNTSSNESLSTTAATTSTLAPVTLEAEVAAIINELKQINSTTSSSTIIENR